MKFLARPEGFDSISLMIISASKSAKIRGRKKSFLIVYNF